MAVINASLYENNRHNIHFFFVVYVEGSEFDADVDQDDVAT